MNALDPQLRGNPRRQFGKEMSRTARSCHEYRVVEAVGSQGQASPDIIRFQVRQFFDDLVSSQPGRQKVEHIDDANSHDATARLPSTLAWVHGHSFQ